MKIPEDLTIDNSIGQVICRLQKSLYGLKQTSRCWSKKFTAFFNKLNLIESDADKCIFSGNIDNFEVFLVLYNLCY